MVSYRGIEWYHMVLNGIVSLEGSIISRMSDKTQRRPLWRLRREIKFRLEKKVEKSSGRFFYKFRKRVFLINFLAASVKSLFSAEAFKSLAGV